MIFPIDLTQEAKYDNWKETFSSPLHCRLHSLCIAMPGYRCCVCQPKTVGKLMAINNQLITLAKLRLSEVIMLWDHWLDRAESSRKAFNKQAVHLAKKKIWIGYETKVSSQLPNLSAMLNLWRKLAINYKRFRKNGRLCKLEHLTTSKAPFGRWTGGRGSMCLNVCIVTRAFEKISPILCKMYS